MTMNPLLKPWHERPYSWSQHSAWEYDKNEWYKRYILGEKTPETPALVFGKKFAESVEFKTPMAPVIIYSKTEHGVTANLDGLNLVGYFDTWEPDELKLVDHKTGKVWTQKKVDETGQFTFYCLLNYLTLKVKPEDHDIKLQSIPCGTRPDFTYGFDLDENGNAQIFTFDTRRTMRDILQLASDIKTRRKEMEVYAQARLASIPT